MKTRTITMREKIIASAASAALAASMVVCVPGMAFASIDAENSSITATTTSGITVATGAQVDMSTYFNANAVSSDGLYHVDYKITDGSGATINKHSGLLTATSEGTVTVTAYLTGIAKPQQNKNNPCEETSVSGSVKVKIESESSYGFQGVGGLAIKMTDPKVTSVSGSDDAGWLNGFTGLTAESDGYYYFTVQLNNGFKSYASPEKFAARNSGNISLVNSEGVSGATLNNSNSGYVSIDSVDLEAKTIDVKVDQKAVQNGYNKLVFGSGFVANNNTNVLGTTITFVIA